MLKYKFDVEPESVDMLHGDMLKPFTVFLINGGRIGFERGNRIEYRVHGGAKGKSVTINMKLVSYARLVVINIHCFCACICVMVVISFAN